MRILVAGGTGLLGRAAVQALRDAEHEVVVVSRSAAPAPGVTAIAADIGAAPPALDAVGRVDAIVNLVGIAIPHGDNTFERAHVDAVRHLIALAKDLKVRRFVHISVVRVPGATGPYHATKARAEALVRAEPELDWTILRPGLVYGPGDDMMSNLVGYVMLAPVFPVPGGKPGPLQVTDVRDVALAVVQAVQRDVAVGQTYDVVGPARFSLAQLVGEVARALALPTWTPPVPQAAMRLAAALGERLLPNAPVTTTQLGMLIAGLYGDPEPARRDLDLHPRPLTPERIRGLATEIRPPLPSVRLAPSRDHARLLEAGRVASRSSLRWVPVAATLGLLSITALLPRLGVVAPWHWLGVLAVYLAVSIGALRSRALPWRELLRPSWLGLALGLAAAGVMLGGALLAVPALRSIAPTFVAPASEIYGWATTASAPMLIVFSLIIVGEDITWRGATTVMLCGRYGPVLGCAGAGALFALVHVALGPPVLWLAAFVAGATWSALTVRTRSVIPTLVCHVAWDAAMVALQP